MLFKKVSFDCEENSSRILLTMLTKLTSVLLLSILFFGTFSVQSCPMQPNLLPETDSSLNSCCSCCANSSATLPKDDAEQHQCPCQMTESQPGGRSPAVVISRYDGKPETFFVTSEIGGISGVCLPQLITLSPTTFFLPDRDRPLYLLYSILLI